MDNIKVVRIITYTGPRDRVEYIIERSLHGHKYIGAGDSVRLTGDTISEDVLGVTVPQTATDLLLAKIRRHREIRDVIVPSLTSRR